MGKEVRENSHFFIASPRAFATAVRGGTQPHHTQNSTRLRACTTDDTQSHTLGRSNGARACIKHHLREARGGSENIDDALLRSLLNFAVVKQMTMCYVCNHVHFSSFTDRTKS